jgi:hypothetical protein
MASPAATAGQKLVDLGICAAVDTPSGWTLKVGKSTAEPDQLITMYDTGGMPPNPKWAVDFPTIMATVRGKPNAYNAAWTKARAVRDALLGLFSQDLGGDRWVSITCPGDVGFVGYDDLQRPELTVNFRLIIEPTAVGNREAL